MRKVVFLVCLTILSANLFANDTLIFKISNTWRPVKLMGGNYIRKAIPTADSGFLVLDYNETNLISRGYYSDTDFIVKMYHHYFYNPDKGFLQEIQFYDSVGKLNLRAELNRKGDTIWRQTFKNEVAINSKVFPQYESDRTIFFSMQKPAVYRGGSVAWKQFIAANLKYPNEAIKNKTEGIVMVEFTISKDGKVSRPKVVQSAGAVLDAEAIRLIGTSSNWIPAEVNGNKVNSVQKRPVVFKLQAS